MISQLASPSIKGLSGSHHPWGSQDHTDSSNPTASAGVDRCQKGTFKTPVFSRLARLEKRLDLGSATRNTTPQAPCTELHGRYRRPKELARNAKNPGKTRVFERRGQEPNYLMFSQCFRDSSRGATWRQESCQNSGGWPF
jgi:hypothetical protein